VAAQPDAVLAATPLPPAQGPGQEAAAAGAGVPGPGARLPFEHVVERHGSVILRVCRALVGAQDAEDAWSETFLAALRAYPQLAAGANVEAWLVAIARNKCVDAHRRTARLPLPLAELPERPSSSDPFAALERNDDLWVALQKLPDKQLHAVVYHHLAGLPYAQVADLLGNSEAAARRAAADGIRSLRRTLPPESPLDPGPVKSPGGQP
jgi:RNA polymerase sigma factor (sigma-70 family)